MTDAELVALLQWALPRLGLRWAGFRNVRATVRKRVARRIAALGLRDVAAYRARLEADPEEWSVLSTMCRIPISRFYRDRAVYDAIVADVLAPLAAAAAREARALRVWSAGCASGEEPFTIAIAWQVDLAPRFPGVALEIHASDVDPIMIERAERGVYLTGSLRELPDRFRAAGFDAGDAPGTVRVKPEIRAAVTFRCEDVRASMPEGLFDLVLSRNLAFTYFDEATQRDFALRVGERLRPGGALVVGAHEDLGPRAFQTAGLVPTASRCIARKPDTPA
ncbi:MAG: chemotaxis protein CheR [Labilithrix sp.]|nr:chemotaxis protein CheR [Labilithrix sp.]